MFAGVSKHCMVCHVSQGVEKPNQLITPYPHQKAPIVDVVEPLPKTS